MIFFDIQVVMGTIASMIPLSIMMYKDNSDDGAWLGVFVYNFIERFRKC